MTVPANYGTEYSAALPSMPKKHYNGLITHLICMQHVFSDIIRRQVINESFLVKIYCTRLSSHSMVLKNVFTGFCPNDWQYSLLEN